MPLLEKFLIKISTNLTRECMNFPQSGGNHLRVFVPDHFVVKMLEKIAENIIMIVRSKNVGKQKPLKTIFLE